MRPIKEGDVVRVFMNDEHFSGTVLHVPQDVGDLWYIETSGTITAINPCSSKFDSIVKFKDRKEEKG